MEKESVPFDTRKRKGLTPDSDDEFDEEEEDQDQQRHQQHESLSEGEGDSEAEVEEEEEEEESIFYMSDENNYDGDGMYEEMRFEMDSNYEWEERGEGPEDEESMELEMEDVDCEDNEGNQRNICWEEEEEYWESVDPKLLALVTFYCKEGVSEKFVWRMMSLMSVIYGERPPFSHTDVIAVLRRMKRKLIRNIEYFCKKCGLKRKSKDEKCSKCNEKRNEVLNRISLIKCDLEYQIFHQLKWRGNEIIEAHYKLHYGTGAFPENDIRGHRAYRSNMESKKEYENQQITLLFTVFSDGAAFKSISRREVTPVLLRLEGFNSDSNSGGNKFMVLAMVFADGGVKKEFVDTFVERSFSNMPTTITMYINGRVWKFNLKILTFMADMKERALLTRLPNWFQEQGCSECLTEGKKKRKGTITYCNYNKFSQRTDASVIRSASNGTEGFTVSKVSAVIGHGLYCTLNDFNVLFMGLFYGLILQSSPMGVESSLSIMLTALYRLHCSLEPNSLTIKFHAFYNHMSTHAMKFGYKHTSEVFEREHKNLMNSVHHQSTNCEQSIVVKKRCHVHSSVGNYVFSAAGSGNSKFTNYTMVCYKNEADELKFGEIELILRESNKIYLIVEEYEVEPATTVEKRTEEVGISTLAKEVLISCRALPQVYGHVIGSSHAVVPAETVISAAIQVILDGEKYMMMNI
ncbi:unnamed protein product [Caenorhabditis nigoni]